MRENCINQCCERLLLCYARRRIWASLNNVNTAGGQLLGHAQDKATVQGIHEACTRRVCTQRGPSTGTQKADGGALAIGAKLGRGMSTVQSERWALPWCCNPLRHRYCSGVCTKVPYLSTLYRHDSARPLARPSRSTYLIIALSVTSSDPWTFTRDMSEIVVQVTLRLE